MAAGAPDHPLDEASKPCPRCTKRIKLAAIVCGYCGYRFRPEEGGREATVVAEVLPGAATRWGLVVDQVPPERRTALLAILGELEPTERRELTGAIFDARDLRVAGGLSLGRVNALVARLVAAGVPARKVPEHGASPMPPRAPGRRARRAPRPRRRRRTAAGAAAWRAALGALVVVALVLGYLDLVRYRSHRAISAPRPASPASRRAAGGPWAEAPAAPAPPSRTAAEARDPAEGLPHIFFFGRGDRLATLAGEPIGTVERIEPAHTFPNGKVGAAYVVRTPARALAVFPAAPLERAAHLQ